MTRSSVCSDFIVDIFITMRKWIYYDFLVALYITLIDGHKFEYTQGYAFYSMDNICQCMHCSPITFSSILPIKFKFKATKHTYQYQIITSAFFHFCNISKHKDWIFITQFFVEYYSLKFDISYIISFNTWYFLR